MSEAAKKEIFCENSIDVATMGDIPQLIALSYAGFDEVDAENSKCPIDFNKVMAHLETSIKTETVFVKRNEHNPEILDGMCGFRVSSPWCSSGPALISFMFYIKREKRSFSLAKSLLSAVKDFSLEHDIPVFFDLLTPNDSEKKKKLLLYLGFVDGGSWFGFNYKKVA